MELKRALGLRTVVSTSAGLTFATSCFVAAAQVATALVGDSAWIAILVAGLLSLLSAASFSELNGMYPTSSGLRLYMKHAFGDKAAIIFSLFYMLVVTTVVGTESFVLGNVLTHAVPAVHPFLWVTIMLVIATFMNLRGVKVAGAFQDIITYGMIASLVVIALVGLGKLGWQLPDAFHIGSGGNLFQAVSVGVFLFIGFEWVTPLAEEVTEASLIPKGMFIAVGLLSVVYALFTAVMVPFLKADGLLASPIPQILFAEKILGVTGLVWMTLTSLGASITTFNAGLVTVSRFMYASARENLLPKTFAKIDMKFATPQNAILTVGVIGLVCSAVIFITKDYLTLVYAGAATEAIVWAVAGALVVILRIRQPEVQRPYKMWAGKALGLVTALVFATLGLGSLFDSPASAVYMVLGLAACWGYVQWVVPTLKARAETERLARAAARPQRPQRAAQ